MSVGKKANPDETCFAGLTALCAKSGQAAGEQHLHLFGSYCTLFLIQLGSSRKILHLRENTFNASPDRAVPDLTTEPQ